MHRIKFWLQRGISKISKGSRNKGRVSFQSLFKVTWENRQKGLGIVLVLFSVLAGNWASNASENAALLKWEKAHLPSLQVLSYAAGNRGMTEMKDIRQIQRCLRSLSVSVDEKGMFWLSEDSNWITYFSGGDEVMPQVYCLICSLPPSKWSPMGIGWRGLEETMASVDAQIETGRLRIPSKKSPSVRTKKDLRAIEY